MTRDFRSHLRSTGLLGLLMLVALVLILSSLSCQQVSDPAGSQSLSLAADPVTACIDTCNAQAATRTTAQAKTHSVMLYLCKGNATCIAAENTRYAAALAQIESDRLACINNCHHQGGVSAGQ